jgi:hypothetical protein
MFLIPRNPIRQQLDSTRGVMWFNQNNPTGSRNSFHTPHTFTSPVPGAALVTELAYIDPRPAGIVGTSAGRKEANRDNIETRYVYWRNAQVGPPYQP